MTTRARPKPRRASRGNAAKEQELAERAACPRGPAAPGGNLPAQGWHRGNIPAQRPDPSAAAAPENVGARPSATSNPEIISLWSNGLPAAGRCRGPSPAGYRRTRPHQVLEIQCRDRCGRCGRKWRPPFWCSGIAACLNDAVHGCQRILNQLNVTCRGEGLDGQRSTQDPRIYSRADRPRAPICGINRKVKMDDGECGLHDLGQARWRVQAPGRAFAAAWAALVLADEPGFQLA